MEERGRRLHAALMLMDENCEDLDGAPERVALLKRWMRGVPAEIRQQTLTAIIDGGDARPIACRMLVNAGADPYGYSSNTTSGTLTCPVLQVFNYPDREMTLLLETMLGKDPITRKDQLPRWLIRKYGDGTETRKTLLEHAAVELQFETVDWILSRIDRNSEARELLYDLGECTLIAIEKARSQSNVRSTNGPLILPITFPEITPYLAAGADFRNERAWLTVANAAVYNRTGASDTLLHALTSESGTPTMAPARMRAIKALIENAPIDINRRGSNGKTMLIQAVANRNTDLVRLLLEHGADPTVKCDIGAGPLGEQSALDDARRLGLSEIIPLLEVAAAKKAIDSVMRRTKGIQTP
jgi:hypothetical protein